MAYRPSGRKEFDIDLNTTFEVDMQYSPANTIPNPK
jgi:hypothetical protein